VVIKEAPPPVLAAGLLLLPPVQPMLMVKRQMDFGFFRPLQQLRDGLAGLGAVERLCPASIPIVAIGPVAVALAKKPFVFGVQAQRFGTFHAKNTRGNS
jgi:hypothetical protein